MDFTFASEATPQSLALTSLFDTFVPTPNFGEILNANNSINLGGEPWTHDSLFGFMNGNSPDARGSENISWDRLDTGDTAQYRAHQTL
jgi:hypothetical protein